MAKATTRRTLAQVRERVQWARDHSAESMKPASGEASGPYIEGRHDMADWVLDMIDGDFYEDDEDPDDVRAKFDAGPHGVTARPDDGEGGTVRNREDVLRKQDQRDCEAGRFPWEPNELVVNYAEVEVAPGVTVTVPVGSAVLIDGPFDGKTQQIPYPLTERIITSRVQDEDGSWSAHAYTYAGTTEDVGVVRYRWVGKADSPR